MGDTLTSILLVAVVPAAAAVLLAWVCRLTLPGDVGTRYALPLPVAVAFLCGYWLLPDWAALRPERHWQWLPYLGLAGAMVGGLTTASGVNLVERWLVQIALATGAAWLLVPSWANDTAMPLLAVCLFVLMAAVEALPERLRGRLCLALIGVMSLMLAALLAIGVSMKFGALGGILAFAIAGGCAGLTRFDQPAAAIRGCIPVIAVLAGGLAFVGTIEPSPPMISIATIKKVRFR